MFLRLAVLLLLGWIGSAQAMRFELSGNGEILATGPIVPGDAGRLRALVDSLPPRAAISGIRIASPGGNVAEAETLAAAVRAVRLPVTVGPGSICASACFLIFAAAPDRRVGPEAHIGVHSASINGQDSATAMAVTTELARRAGAYGVPPEIIGRMVTTGPRHMDWLSATDLAAMGAREVK